MPGTCGHPNNSLRVLCLSRFPTPRFVGRSVDKTGYYGLTRYWILIQFFKLSAFLKRTLFEWLLFYWILFKQWVLSQGVRIFHPAISSRKFRKIQSITYPSTIDKNIVVAFLFIQPYVICHVSFIKRNKQEKCEKLYASQGELFIFILSLNHCPQI